MISSEHCDSCDLITAQHHYHVRLTVFLITLPLSLCIDVARRGCGGSILLLPSCHDGNVFTYSVHRYHYYHHTMIRSDTAEISIYTMRRVALCVLTNNSEDNEYIQVFMVLFIHVLQNLQVPVSKSSSCHPCQIVKYRAAHFHVLCTDNWR